MLIYCVYLKANKYKYSYGRKANKTFKDFLVPNLDEINKKIPHYNVETPSFKYHIIVKN
ncbi:hypothetical protein ['Camptotheca acuminata' phytoplasma]|uniref:hypothetical protein n=1 Tax='Camptotheca acuminata' phytoplasma TaxID=3239192 RepID=UPI00351A1544